MARSPMNIGASRHNFMDAIRDEAFRVGLTRVQQAGMPPRDHFMPPLPTVPAPGEWFRVTVEEMERIRAATMGAYKEAPVRTAPIEHDGAPLGYTAGDFEFIAKEISVWADNRKKRTLLAALKIAALVAKAAPDLHKALYRPPGEPR